MTATADLLTRDIAHLIHPLHEEPLQRNARVWVKGDGAILTDADGREYIDGLAGLWNVTGRARPDGAGRRDARAGRRAGLRIRVRRQLQPARHRVGRAPRRTLLPVHQPLLLHQRRRRGDRQQHQDGARVLEAARPAGQDEGDLPDQRLPRGHARGDERHRPEPLLAALRAAGAGLLAHPRPRPVPLRGAARREPGRGCRERARTGHPARGARHGGDVHRRARAGRGRRHRSPGRLLPAHPRDLRPVRRAARRRRGYHRLRPDRAPLRARALGRRAGHHAVRQGDHVGVLPLRRHRHQRPGGRDARRRRRAVDARLQPTAPIRWAARWPCGRCASSRTSGSPSRRPPRATSFSPGSTRCYPITRT